MNRKMSRENKETKIWQEYQAGLRFQRSMGFSEKFPEYERFKEGEQWPSVTERTRALPRPVFNIVKLFVSNKKANVLSQNIKMIYTPAETGTNPTGEDEITEHAIKGATDYTDYASWLWYDLNQDTLNDKVVDDAATTGTGIFHYYWDSSIKGGEEAPYIGALRGENIDPLNFFVANPQESNVQKQEWVIISSRDTVKNVREFAKENGVEKKYMELILPDTDISAEGYDTARLEQDGTEKITVLTKYYKKDGQVRFSKATRAVMLAEDKSLTPTIISEEEIKEKLLRGEELERLPNPIDLYPIAVFNWQSRKKCIFGTGEVDGIIPNQKAINFNIAMMLLSVQDNAWPKLLVKPGALRKTVTNMPGEILTDYYTSGDGVKYMQPPNFNYMAVNLVDKVMELSRTTSGVTEVATGETLGANMAASAIVALQNQAKVPIDNIQKRFYRCIKEVGKIWEQFFKTYYNTGRSMITQRVGGGQDARTFTGTDYSHVEFNLKIDVGASSIYSEALALSTLDKLFDTGNISIDEYIELVPDTVMPFKNTLKKMREAKTLQQGEETSFGNMQAGQSQNTGGQMSREGGIMNDMLGM